MKLLSLLCLAFVLLAGAGMDVAAQTTCGGWNSTCVSRCKARGAADCPYCSQQMTSCKKSGCWTESKQNGGAKHCNLGKS
jgi:hypothetical protein